MKKIYAFLILLLSINVSAQEFYQTSGPAGSGGNCFWIYPEGDLVFVAFNDRLFRSTDGGESYEVISSFFDADLSTARYIGRVGDYLVAGLNSADRIYRSADDGITWEPVFEGLPTVMGFPAAVPNSMFTDGDLMVMGGTNFIAQSNDEGATWQPLDGVLGSTTYGINKLGDTWYACTSANESNLPGYPIWKSTDNGTSWSALPAAPETDLGIGNPISQNSTAFAEYNGELYAITESNAGDALQKSADDGATWESVGDFIFGKYILNIDDVLYVTSFQGLDRSSDGGVTWEPVLGPEYFGFGFHGYMVQEGNTLWVATSQGPVTVDLTTDEITESAIPSASVPFIVAADGIIVGVDQGEAIVSNDGGQNYNAVNDLISPNFEAISASIAAGAIYLFGAVDGASDYAIFVSNDAGATWTQLTGLPENNSAGTILSYNPLIYGAGAGSDLTFYRSDDDGSTWNEATVTVEGDPLNPDAVVQNIEQHGDYLFADITNGFGYSTDGGNSWTVRATDTDAPVYGWAGRFIRMYTHPIFQTRTLELSTDDGATWEGFIEGFPSNFGLHYPNGLAMVDGKIIVQNDPFLGWFDNPGAFYSLSEGDAAYQQEVDLGIVMSTALDISGSDLSDLYVTTLGSGIYTNAAPLSTSQYEVIESLKLYPNPTKAIVTIDDQVEEYWIFDSTGRLLEHSKFKTSQRTLDLSARPTGIYLVKTWNGEKFSSGRVMKL